MGNSNYIHILCKKMWNSSNDFLCFKYNSKIDEICDVDGMQSELKMSTFHGKSLQT